MTFSTSVGNDCGIEANNIQLGLQMYAERGLIICRENCNAKLSQKVHKLGIARLLALTIAAWYFSLPTIVPVIFAVSAVGMLVYAVHNIYAQVILKKKSIPLIEIFTQILQANYESAYRAVDLLMPNVSGAEYYEFERKQMYIGNEPVRLSAIHSSLAALKAIKSISEGHHKDEKALNDTYKEIEKWCGYMRLGNEFFRIWCKIVKDFNDPTIPKTPFIARPYPALA